MGGIIASTQRNVPAVGKGSRRPIRSPGKGVVPPQPTAQQPTPQSTVQPTPQPTVPAPGGKTPIVPGPNIDPVRPFPTPQPYVNPNLPTGYQSAYKNYGFDQGLQNYLDEQRFKSHTGGGTSFRYDPNSQTFMGGTRAGRYNPIPLSVMQQAATGNQNALNPYFMANPVQPTVAPNPVAAPFTPPPLPAPVQLQQGNFEAMKQGGLASLRRDYETE